MYLIYLLNLDVNISLLSWKCTIFHATRTACVLCNFHRKKISYSSSSINLFYFFFFLSFSLYILNTEYYLLSYIFRRINLWIFESFFLSSIYIKMQIDFLVKTYNVTIYKSNNYFFLIINIFYYFEDKYLS